MLSVPEVVRNKARAAGADRWLVELPLLVAELESEWAISVGEPFLDGTEAYVARATTETGDEAVLKILVPRTADVARNEITVLELVAGEGCPLLHRSDVDRGALLMERLGPSLHDLGLPVAERHDILAGAARRLWRRAPGCGLPTGAAKGEWLIENILGLAEELDDACSSRVVDHAVACGERRVAAHDDERAVLVHGDVHEWNALRSSRGFALIDPDGLLAEPEYDLGVLMREDPLELLAETDPWNRAHRLAASVGGDATAIWEWGVVERVSTGLLATRIGLQPIGRQMLEVAEQLVVR